MKHSIALVTILLLVPLDALHAADAAAPTTCESREMDSEPMRSFRTLLTAMLLAPLAALPAAEPVTDLLGARGLPRVLCNNDGEDVIDAAYPDHHGAVWVPAGEPLPIRRDMKVEDFLAYRIGPLAKTAATGLSYCGNFDTPIWELPRDRLGALGDDPLQPLLQFWRRDGRTFFFSMRMNDAHHMWFNWPNLWDDFRRTHRHCFLKPPTADEWANEYLPWLDDKTPLGPKDWIVKPRTPKPISLRPSPSGGYEAMQSDGENLLYDYSRAEVRTRYLEIVREACRRYDLDGVELDWLRYPKFFRDGEVNPAVLTEFVREVRTILDEAAKRRGHALRLVTRVPDAPARAKELGLDVEAWLKAGWIDAVIAGNGFTFASNALDQWVALAHRHHVPVYGVIERMPRGFARYGTPETLRAAAATLWARGADGLYTFNFYNTAEYPLLGELADPAKLALLPKEFFLDACTVPKATNNTVGSPPLPLTIHDNASGNAVLFLTDDPAQAKDLRLVLAWKGSGEFAAPDILVNGRKLEELTRDREQSSFTAVSAFRLEKGESPLTVSSTSASLAQLLRRGANEFVFTSPSTTTLTALSVKITPNANHSPK
jgi:hypothetical protein